LALTTAIALAYQFNAGSPQIDVARCFCQFKSTFQHLLISLDLLSRGNDL